MEIPEPAAAKSFWTLPNHQFSDPLLLRNPCAYPCGFISVPLFSSIFRDRSTHFCPLNFPDAEAKERQVFASESRFLNFCPRIFKNGGEKDRLRFRMCSSDEKSIIIQCRRCKTSSRRRFLPSRTRKLFLLPPRRELFQGCYRRLCELYMYWCFFTI